MLETFRGRVSDQRGMTLIELMVTLMVVSVLMAIAIPTTSTYLARQELSASGREVVEVFREAREAAMNEGQPRYVLFSPADRSYRVYRFDGSNWVAEEQTATFGPAISFSDADVTFPALADTPVTGESVPENAAYFDTRGRYPFQGIASTYEITLRSRDGRSVKLTLHTGTGQVTGL